MTRKMPSARTKSRSYGDLTIASPSRIKRFSHRARFSRAIQLLDPRPGDRILDYGSGDGFFLGVLHDHEPRLELCGFDPATDDEFLRVPEEVMRIVPIHDSLGAV